MLPSMKKRLNRFADQNKVPILAFCAAKNGGVDVTVEIEGKVIHGFLLNRAAAEKIAEVIKTPGASCVAWPEVELLVASGS